MPTKPTIAEYQPVGAPMEQQTLVHRPMTAAEYREHKKNAEAATAAEANRKHPLVAQVLAMNDDERAELAALLK